MPALPWPLPAVPPPPKLLTLVIPRAPGRVLLGLKKRGFGAGFWNGYGGKVEPSETVDAAAARELTEECGLVAHNLRRRGTLTFRWHDTPVPWQVAVYDVTQWAGEPVETDEMKPQWFDEHSVPFGTMWPDDRIWYPLFLRGAAFRGVFWFKDKTLVDHSLEEVGEELADKEWPEGR